MDNSANLIGKNLEELRNIFMAAGYETKDPSLLAHNLYKKYGKPLSSIEAYPKSLRWFLEDNFSIEVYNLF